MRRQIGQTTLQAAFHEALFQFECVGFGEICQHCRINNELPQITDKQRFGLENAYHLLGMCFDKDSVFPQCMQCLRAETTADTIRIL